MYQGKRIGAIILARMRSSRLPGKVMLSLNGKPVLQHIVERLSNSKYLDNIIIATSDDISCLPIENLCHRLNCSIYRGDEEDVLDRFTRASRISNVDIVVRITGDCPMVDWRIVDQVIEGYFTYNCDYSSNVNPDTFPIGFDVEVFSTGLLEYINEFAEGVDRKHITTYIYKTHPEKYKMFNLKATKLLHHPEYRVTLDTLEDYIVLHTLFDILEPGFSAEDVVRKFLALPMLYHINSKVEQKDWRVG